MLRDPAASEMSWVTLPEPMALEETADALAALAAAGIRVRRLIVNRVTAARRRRRASGAQARRRFEARAMSRRVGVGASPDRELVTLPELRARAARRAARGAGLQQPAAGATRRPLDAA